MPSPKQQIADMALARAIEHLNHAVIQLHLVKDTLAGVQPSNARDAAALADSADRDRALCADLRHCVREAVPLTEAAPR